MTCAILSFIAKTIGHLPWTLFQQNTAKLCDIFCTSPVQIANELYGKELISREIKDRMLEVTGQTVLEKVSFMVSRLGAVIASAGGSGKPLRQLISVMKKHAQMKRLAEEMDQNLG